MPASSGGRRASSSSSRRSTNTNNGPPPPSSSATATTTITTVMLRASVLVAMLAVALPTGWRWWQQHAALNDRGTVLEVRLDPKYRKYVEAFAADEDLFFKRFSAAYAKLMELGVPAFSGKGGAGGAFDSLKGALGLKK